MGQNVDRRSLLAGTGAAVMATAMPMALGASIALADEPQAGWDLETEVLVIGAGGAGITAAVAAADAGAQVTVIEKAAVECETGYGATRSSGGNACSVTDKDAAIQYLEASNLGYMDEEIESVWAESCMTVERWLNDHGINCNIQEGFGADFPNFPGASGLQAIQISDPDDPVNVRGGAYYLRLLIPYLKEHGGELIIGTAAKELIQNADGVVVGVVAEQGGTDIRIHASKGVIMACGGFEGSEEMLFNYMRTWPLAGMSWPLNTGDGVKMCQRIGADLWHMNNCCSQGYGFQYPGFFELRTGLNGASWPAKSYIFVNKLGNRFLCENPNKAGGPYGHRCYLDYNTFDTSNEQVDGGFRDNPFYAVMDSKVIQAGPIFKPSPNSGIRAVDPADGGLDTEWSEDNQAEIEAGYILQADSLEELAEKINANSAHEGYVMDPAALVATVETYNGYCESGEDPDFGRPAEDTGAPNLVPLDTPPYYALRLEPSLYNTLGGPRKNAKGEILDVDGNPIGHLYAAGAFSETMAQSYTTYGQNWAEILSFGRITGENAAAAEPAE